MDLIIKAAVLDKLAGELKNYVGLYIYAKETNNNLDYKIDGKIINEINKNQSEKITPWYLQIANCENLNDLPNYQQELIKQYMPTFLKNNPQFENAEIIKSFLQKEHYANKFVSQPGDLQEIDPADITNKSSLYYQFFNADNAERKGANNENK